MCQNAIIIVCQIKLRKLQKIKTVPRKRYLLYIYTIIGIVWSLLRLQECVVRNIIFPIAAVDTVGHAYQNGGSAF